ncbi:MAG: hypothetical protein LBR67_05165 [Dysgonamonadaceae bacterium]|jgi:hypothetical protein|nr:hypothetical protein [Dysgonamonadaceae bacterium]
MENEIKNGNEPPKKKKREKTGKVYYYPDGIKTEFKFNGDRTGPISPLGMWLRENYPAYKKIRDEYAKMY